MTIEQQALDLVAENEALKAQVNELKSGLDFMIQRPFDENDFVSMVSQCNAILDKTPEQCLNSVKSEAVCEFANKYCKNCTTDYQSQLSEDAWNHCEELGINNESPR